MRAGEPEGWYPCPSNATVLRYWNGENWLGHMAPASQDYRHHGWLVMGLEWPSGHDMAEAALAVSPPLIHEYLAETRGDRSRRWNQHVAGLTAVWGRAAQERPGVQTLFLSDLTDYLERNGTSWGELGIDWETAEAEVNKRADDGGVPALWLTISQLAHILLCSTPRSKVTLYTPQGPELLDMAEREKVRASLTDSLRRDWTASTGFPV